jgi:hypothetical protein
MTQNPTLTRKAKAMTPGKPQGQHSHTSSQLKSSRTCKHQPKPHHSPQRSPKPPPTHPFLTHPTMSKSRRPWLRGDPAVRSRFRCKGRRQVTADAGVNIMRRRRSRKSLRDIFVYAGRRLRSAGSVCLRAEEGAALAHCRRAPANPVRDRGRRPARPSHAPVLARRHGHAVWPQRPPASPLLRARRRAPRVVAHAERPARAFGGGAQPDMLCRAGAAAEAARPQRLERAYPDVAGGGKFASVSVFGARPACQHPAVSSSAARARSTSARLAKGHASAATGVRSELSGI